MDQLTDQTGNGRNWTQTGSDRPIFSTNEINSLGAADCNGISSKYWNGPDLSSLTAAHIFVITKLSGSDPNASAAYTGLWRLGTQSDDLATHWPFTDGIIYDGALSTVRKTTVNPGPVLTTFRVYEVISTSSEWTSKLDYTQLFTTATNTVGGSATPRLGRGNSSTTQYNFPGLIAGIYIFSAKKAGSDLTDFQDYILDTFAIP